MMMGLISMKKPMNLDLMTLWRELFPKTLTVFPSNPSIPVSVVEMTLLRSREVVRKEVEIQPLTPAKEVEPTNKYETTPQKPASMAASSDSGNQGLRRSARLSSKPTSSRKRKAVSGQDPNAKVSARNVGVSRGLDASSIPVFDLGTEQQYDEDIQKLNMEDDAGKGCLKLRSGKKLLKEIQSSEVVVNQGIEAKRNASDKAWKRFSREDKKKGALVDGDEESGLEKISAAQELEIRSKTTTVGEEMDIDDTHIKEKEKEKVVEVHSSSNMVDSHLKSGVDNGTIAETVSLEQAAIASSTSATRDHMERFKSVARRNASRFAYFSAQQEEEEPPLADEVQMEASDDVEDWPGPFSTAMKIIKDRAANMGAQQKVLTKDKIQSVPSIWVPKEKQQNHRPKKVAPSLQELCMTIIAENVDAITSLENVPDVLRHKLTHLLCDSRKMNHHFFDLLASGSPSEIRIKDCSWLNEEQFTKTFERSDTSNLTVLQLDQCGRCLPDYVLFTTLAHLPSKLSALTNISLKGACRLSDAGLSALVASAPALRSINLGCCSLLTSDGIIDLADKLGPILKELYIDECFGIDAIRILPALLKLEHLEVLSISRFETVNDSFVRQFVAVGGKKMKELVLADCTKLTDKSLKAIAESCPGLCAIDLTNLSKLTDTAIGYLANGCQTIQTMKFCRNAFSDEAVAAYIEACGEPLKELSLNHVDEVGHHTALSLAKHARNLLSLDLSWCRNMTNEALGLIVDSCSSLKMVKLFGCTQLTNVFIDGHSNEEVRITGLKESQILKNTQVHDHSFPLRYSSL